MLDRISICENLTKRNQIEAFLKRKGTGDEKWATYDNIMCENVRGQTRINGQEGFAVCFVGLERNYPL